MNATTRRVYKYIAKHQIDTGLTPSYREIRDGCGLSSTSLVSYHISKLEIAGHIRRVPKISRGIVLVTTPGGGSN